MSDKEVLRTFSQLYDIGIGEFFNQQDPSAQEAFMGTYSNLEGCGLIEGMTFLEVTTLADREPRYIIGLPGEITAKGRSLLEN